MEDKFKLYKKWFWIGIVVGFFNFVAGLIYGIALVVEKEHRKEGLIIIGWAIVAFILTFYLGVILRDAGVLPDLGVISVKESAEQAVIPVE